jgi:hypothetical protein
MKVEDPTIAWAKVERTGSWWGTKWGTKLHVAQPISAKPDFTETA